MFVSKYGVARHIYIPLIKRGVTDFANSGDWTPAAGDVKISKDGGAAANVTNLPTAIAMGNASLWDFSITATEMQAAQVVITVADSATKAVEDSAIEIETHGNASAQFGIDWSLATPPANLTQIDGLTNVGGTAVLNLKQFNIINSAGSALVCTSSGSNGHGAVFTGNGSGSGQKKLGGATGHGDQCIGNGAAGNGHHAESLGGACGYFGRGGPSDKNAGMRLEGGLGSTGGDGLATWGYGTGAGMAPTGGNQTGFSGAVGGGPAIDAKSITGHAVQMWGGVAQIGVTGSTDGSALQLLSGLIISETTGAGTASGNDVAGVYIRGSGIREGIFSQGGSNSGATDGGAGAIFYAPVNGDGITLSPAGSGKYGISGTLGALKTTLADSIPADGTRPTIEQALYMITQFLTERAVSSTTLTVKKVDGSTALMTFTLNDATSPTSITRAT